METHYMASVRKQFKYYKQLGERTMSQISDEQLFTPFHEDSNSIATLVKHLSGNMLSRWTDFLTSDGEKEWRQRDKEFINDFTDRKALLLRWEEGWKCLFDALDSLEGRDLLTLITIRHEKQSILDAINRQLAHYPYHIGQMVFIGKLYSQHNWQSLSIPKGQSDAYNAAKAAEAQNSDEPKG